jgi:hypothetical protein
MWLAFAFTFTRSGSEILMHDYQQRPYDRMNDARKRIAPFEIKIGVHSYNFPQLSCDSNLCMDHSRIEMAHLAILFEEFTLSINNSREIAIHVNAGEHFIVECDECRGEADVLLREASDETTPVEITEQSLADMHDEYMRHVCDNGVETA